MQLSARLPTKIPSLNVSLGRRSKGEVVGLDIQPGLAVAVRARVNGSIAVQEAVELPLPADTVRDGEVADPDALGDVLRELFAKSAMSRRVRVGVANQRTVLRTLELPPVTDQKELAAAVAFQAQEQVPMPLSNAVLDFHALGIADTPAGPRQRVVLVAAQRDMVERLLGALRKAGLTAEGVDLSAFALIRSLYRRDAEEGERVLYLNVDGLTNLAIAEGSACRFTRVVGSGLEGMAGELAERRGIAIGEARSLIAEVDLTAVPEPPLTSVAPSVAGDGEGEDAIAEDALAPGDGEQAGEAAPLAPPAGAGADPDVLLVVENGIRDISGEVRNSLDFHRSQDGGGEVSHLVLSGAAQDIPGFAEALQATLSIELRSAHVEVLDGAAAGGVSPNRLAVAAGLTSVEASR